MGGVILKRRRNWKTQLLNDWQIYILLLPGIIYFIIFHYIPLYGIQIAFKDYKVSKGIADSAWIGFENFRTFFNSYYCGRLILNTLLLNVYSLLWSFPVPIILALLLNRIKQERFKKFTQTVIYIPHFISTVVMAGMLYIFLSPETGMINLLIKFLGGQPVYFMAEAGWFRTVYIASGIWQSAGWGTILYIAALTGVDQEIYEAATLDGAQRYAENPPHRHPFDSAHRRHDAHSGVRQNHGRRYAKGSAAANQFQHCHLGYYRRIRV